MNQKLIVRLSEVPIDVDTCHCITSLLKKFGLDLKVAHRLVSNEWKITLVNGMKGFNKSLEG